MENWKRAVIAGAAGVSVIMLAKRKKTAGIVSGGISLALLASEYPEEFAKFRKNIHSYMEQGVTFIEIASRLGERVAEATEGRGSQWYEALLAG